MDLSELLAFAVKNGASDIHISADLPPLIRIDGDIRRIKVDSLSSSLVHDMIYDIMLDSQRKEFEERWETDFAFEIPNVASTCEAMMLREPCRSRLLGSLRPRLTQCVTLTPWRKAPR